MSGSSLVSLAWCKDLLSTDERDEATMSLVISSCSTRIEQYLMRRIVERTIVTHFDSVGARELVLPEYPVRSVASVRCDCERVFGEDAELEEGSWYCATVPYDVFEDLPAVLIFDSFLPLPIGSRIIRVEYAAGYPLDHMPEDLQLATAELVAWELRRVKSKQIGVSGLVPTSGRMERAVLEMQMPENVREMLETYRRRTW